jgi:hypothetical protein
MGGVFLPSAAPPAAGWTLVDILDAAARTDPAAGGVAVAAFAQLAGSDLWLIDHAVVSCTSGEGTQVRWYNTIISPSYLLDGSDSGNFDVADWPAGLRVGPSEQLLARWDGADDGAVGIVHIQYRLYRR